MSFESPCQASGSIHDDSVAQKLGFHGGTIAVGAGLAKVVRGRELRAQVLAVEALEAARAHVNHAFLVL